MTYDSRHIQYRQNTSYLYPDTFSSTIISNMEKVIDLTTLTLTTPSSPITQSYAAATTNQQPHTQSQMQRQGTPPQWLTSTKNQLQIPNRSLGYNRSPMVNSLNINLASTKKYYSIINAAGGIATVGIYHTEFNNGGLHHLTTGVSFVIH